MAMTAWAAKFLSNSLLVAERANLRPVDANTAYQRLVLKLGAPNRVPEPTLSAPKTASDRVRGRPFSARTRRMWITCPVRIAEPWRNRSWPPHALHEFRKFRRYSKRSADVTTSSRSEMEYRTSPRRCALHPNIVWNTSPNSPGELEMTLNTSEVAVCCSSVLAAVRYASLSSRAFSMAMTAWAAKCLPVLSACQ